VNKLRGLYITLNNVIPGPGVKNHNSVLMNVSVLFFDYFTIYYVCMRRGDDRIAIDGVGQWSSAIKGGSAKRHWTVRLSAATKPTTTTTHCRRCVHADSVC